MLAVIQETLVYIPQVSKQEYVIQSANFFKDLILQIRSVGWSSLSDSQSWSDLAIGYKNAMTDEYYGKLSLTDVNNISKIKGYNK